MDGRLPKRFLPQSQFWWSYYMLKMFPYSILRFIYLPKSNPVLQHSESYNFVYYFCSFRLVPLWRDGKYRFWKFSESCFLVPFITHTFCSILQFIHIVHTLCDILNSILLYLWSSSSRIFYRCDWFVIFCLIDWNFDWA